jgi:hypothetical protein
MNRDYMKTWQDYFVAEMRERHGIASHEANKSVMRWLNSLGRLSVSQLQQSSELSRNRKRLPTSRSERGSATQSRITRLHEPAPNC